MSYFPWMRTQRRNQSAETDTIVRDRSPAVLASRRGALKALATGGAVALTGGLPLAIGATRPSYAGALEKVRLAWAEPASCHAPLPFAIEKGMFRKQNLDIELTFHGLVGADILEAIASGKTDMGTHLLVDWLKPLHESRADVKVIAGTHDGCQRILASSKTSKIEKVEDLKGKTIAVGAIGDVAYTAFLVTIAKAGLDPHKDVSWVAISYDQLGKAVNSGEADALATLDAMAYLYKKEYDLREIANTQTGHYHDMLCCCLAVRGDFLRNNRDVARRVTSVIFDVYDYTAANPQEVAAFYVEKYKPGYSQEALADVLAALPLRHHPIGGELVSQTAKSVDDMKEVKVLPADVDTAAFTAKITDNILA